jgi:hypothetical protein
MCRVQGLGSGVALMLFRARVNNSGVVRSVKDARKICEFRVKKGSGYGNDKLSLGFHVFKGYLLRSKGLGFRVKSAEQRGGFRLYY